MADLVLGLAKMTVQGTVTMAKSAMEDEAKLHKSVERDLVVISDEFEMMRAFLNHAKEDHDTDDMTRTMVRQVRNMAIDMEDCIETILHLDKKPHWWRRMMPPWCLLAMGPVKDLDAAVANIEQLKARVEAMGQRNLRYNRIGEPGGHKPKKTHQQATVNAIEPNLFVTAADAAMHNARVDLAMLINRKNTNQARRKGGAEEDQSRHMRGGIRDDSDYDINSDDDDNDVDEYYDCDQQKEKENETKPDKAMDSVHQLKVISVLGTGNNIEMMSIMKAYEDPETCKNFNHRAWVKLVHPFNPAEFIRSLLAQFYNNCCPEQDSSEDVLKLMVTIDNALIMEFMRKISEKYLVVLENVSSMVDWEAVRAYLPDKKNGSCIVVHTRQFETACSCVGSGFQVLQMDKLSADDHVIVLLKEDAACNDDDIDEEDEYKKCLEKHPIGDGYDYAKWQMGNPIFGREEDLRWLSRVTCRSGCVASLWGISGVGKSFLIEHFCRKEKEFSYCKLVRLNVPHPFDLRVLLGDLLSELNYFPQDHIVTKDPIQECRKYLLQGQKRGRCCIVMDGLQSTEEWDLIDAAFDFSNARYGRDRFPASVIIITTEETVANYCATNKKLVWNVKCLEVGYAIQLFNQVVSKKLPFRWELNTERDEIRHRYEQSRGILVQKCGGLPKVIHAVAESWGTGRGIKVEHNLVSQLETNKEQHARRREHIFSWLLSYFSYFPDFVKPCIFYLSIFPLNHTFRRRRLVRRWIVEGYSWDNKHFTAEEIANDFFSRLVNMSMIQQVGPRNLSSVTRTPLCQVNGFLREYVLSKSIEENFLFTLEGNIFKNLQRHPETNAYQHHMKRMDMGSIVQHLAIDMTWDRDKNVFESIDFSRLRSLTVFGRWEPFFISAKMGRLRVLDLEDVTSGVTNDDVENMVKVLPRLKFLSLRRCKEITSLPDSLGDLKQLQTLDIRDTSVIKLPKSIIKLEKLQYIRAGTAVILDNDTGSSFRSLPVAEAASNSSTSATPMRRPRAILRSCLPILNTHSRLYDDSHNGIKMPRGIAKLSSLHTLGVININIAGEEGILHELRNLTLLHKLGVSGINRNNSDKFFSAISCLPHLESLSLQFQLNQDHEAAVYMVGLLSPLVKLRSLKLYGLIDRLPACIMQAWLHLQRLEKLSLQMKMLPQQELDSIISLRSLRSLQLRLAEFEDGELRFCWSMDHGFGGWIINFLEIACNSRLQAVRFGSKLDVEILKIRCCSASPSLKFSGLQSLDSLQEVWLSGSYDKVFKQHLESELKESGNEPILKLE